MAVLPARGKTSIADLEIDEEHLLGVTAVQKEVGILRPTVLIGIGSFGRRALQEVRCRLIDRVGDIALVPTYRFLYLDCDPEAVSKATAAPSDIALTPDEVFPVPLQPVTGYRRRQLEQILDWLPREKLYSIPRSLNAGGSRALGRLAFCDNYLRFVTRLRRELQIATHPESISQSSDQTGLLPRDNTPQVYVFAGGTGGAGGMLVDVGFAVRRVLGRMNAGDAPVSAFIYAAAPNDPGTPDHELANLYATLTELNHYADEDVGFAAHYGGSEGPKVEANGLPFSATYLLPMPDRTSASFRDCVAHLAGYVAHDLTTPLGVALEQLRLQQASFGAAHSAPSAPTASGSRAACSSAPPPRRSASSCIRMWHLDAPPIDTARIDRVVTQVMGDSRLKPEAVLKFIEQETPRGPEGGPADQIERWLHGLEGQIETTGRRAEAGAWSRNAWDQTREFIGVRPTNDQDITVRRGRLSKALDEGIRRVAQMWGNEFAAITRPLQEDPGHRIAAIETALQRIGKICIDAAETVDKKLRQVAVKTQQIRMDVQSALDLCQAGSGSFSFFGGRSNRSMRHFLEQLRTFARHRLQEDLLDATARFYRTLQGEIEIQFAISPSAAIGSASSADTRFATSQPAVARRHADRHVRGIAAADAAPDQHDSGGVAARRKAHRPLRAAGAADGEGFRHAAIGARVAKTGARIARRPDGPVPHQRRHLPHAHGPDGRAEHGVPRRTVADHGRDRGGNFGGPGDEGGIDVADQGLPRQGGAAVRIGRRDADVRGGAG